MKVKIFDRRLVRTFLEKVVSIVASVCTIVLIFFDMPDQYKSTAGCVALFILILLYLYLWYRSNSLKKVNLTIEGSEVTVKTGDIFQQSGFKAIAFNEYFDTQVDDKIISKKSLNGIFIEKYSPAPLEELNNHLDNYQFDDEELVEDNVERAPGKTKKYKLGTLCVLGDYLLVAFSKFDNKNKANLTMPEYLEFLVNFWDNVNRVYSQRDVSVPVFGSGITRIKEHKNISDEDLLKIMLWTFRISEMRFKHPAKLSIIIHEDKIDSIDLFDIKEARNGV